MLSGDNALIIGMAAAGLAPELRKKAILYGMIIAAVLTVAVLLAPVALPLLALADLATRSRLRRTRVFLLLIAVLGMEIVGTAVATATTLRFIGRLNAPTAQQRFHDLEHWWAGRHGKNFARLAGLRWVVENPELMTKGNAIVLSRHASHADAILPVLLFGVEGRFALRYTFKTELQWTPAIDIVGNRLPNAYIDRSPHPDAPIYERLAELGSLVDEGSVAVIFPEGTFFTPKRLDRAATRIAETRPDLEARVRQLQHILPPRPAGTLALLKGGSDADLVLVAHEGMETFGDLSAIAANLPLPEPVRVRIWRIPRAEVPADDHELIDWLLDRWLEVDAWIEQAVTERATSTMNLPPQAREINC